MIRNAHHAAMTATIDMAAKMSGAAVLQVKYDFAMFRPQWALFLIIRNMFSENISYLQSVLFRFYDLGHRCCPPFLHVQCQ